MCRMQYQEVEGKAEAFQTTRKRGESNADWCNLRVDIGIRS